MSQSKEEDHQNESLETSLCARKQLAGNVAGLVPKTGQRRYLESFGMTFSELLFGTNPATFPATCLRAHNDVSSDSFGDISSGPNSTKVMHKGCHPNVSVERRRSPE